MNRKLTDVSQDSAARPLEYGRPDGVVIPAAPRLPDLSPLLDPLRPLFVVAAAALLLGAVVSLGLGVWHALQVPDSPHRVGENPAAWPHFATQLLFSRLGLFAVAGGLIALALWRWRGAVNILRHFWYAAAHPMSLGIYRIVLFATILFNLDNDSNRDVITFFAGLPRELYITPTGMELILPHLPINPELAGLALTLMNVFCVTAILGFYSRTSAVLVIVFGLYALGIPQYFGQTNHYHHMFWFAAIAAAAPIGDYLSVDAVLRARRRAAETGATEAPPPARAYGLPLRLITVMIGVCYFFPGLWKYWVSGMAWAFSDNFKHLMEWKWINMGLGNDLSQSHWQPLFRLDHYPWMYKPSAAIALVFEMGFIVLVFFPRAKYLAPLMGVGFHRMIHFMMQIPFYTLQTSYVAFFDWDKIFGWVSRKLFSKPTFVAFDGANERVRKTIAALRSVDLMGPNAVTYVDATDAEALAAAGVRFDRSAGVQAFKGDGRVVSGAAAYRSAAKRNPALWPVFPALLLLPDPAGTGSADASTAAPAAAPVMATRPWAVRHATPIIATFMIVLLPNLVLGVTRKYHAWPFSCYPLFEKPRGHTKPELEVKAFDAQGREIAWDERKMFEKLTKPRYSTMCRRIRENKDPKQLLAFWDMLTASNPQLKDAKVVKFYESKILSAPEDWGKKPVEMQLVHQAVLDGAGAVAPLSPDVRVTSTTDE